MYINAGLGRGIDDSVSQVGMRDDVDAGKRTVDWKSAPCNTKFFSGLCLGEFSSMLDFILNTGDTGNVVVGTIWADVG